MAISTHKIRSQKTAVQPKHDQRYTTHTLCALLLLFTLVIGTGCRTPATQIQLFIDTDAPIERPLTLEVFSFVGAVATGELAVRSNAAITGGLRFVRSSDGSGSFSAGGSIGVVPPADRSIATVTLWLRATLAPTATAPSVVIDRAARLSFVRGRSGTARVFLALRCGDTALGCSSVNAEQCTVSVRCREQGATCGDRGECVAPELPVVLTGNDGAVEDAPTSAVDASAVRADATAETDVATTMDANDGVTSDGTSLISDVNSDGDAAIDAGPPPIHPRLIAPLSLGDVTSLRPTLRWELPDQADGAQIQLCSDRACNSVIETLAVAATSARPTLPLPSRSVVFWRVRATRAMVPVGAYSPVWLFHVPAVDNSGGVDSSRNPHLDLNGDGFDDVAVSSFRAPGAIQNSGLVSIFYGARGGISLMRTLAIQGRTNNAGVGFTVASAGDVNGDGFGDLILGSAARTAYVFHGSASGVEMAAATVLRREGFTDSFGGTVAGAGDVNGDGYADVLVSASAESIGAPAIAGYVAVYHGSVMGIVSTPARIVEGAAPRDQFGWSIAGGFDVNGDGFSDILAGAYNASPAGRMNAGTASVFHGSAMGISATPSSVIEGSGATPTMFAHDVASAGDVNGDGYSDLIIGAFADSPGGRMSAGTASVYHGNAMGVSMMPTRVLAGSAIAENFGRLVAGAGDVNADGFDDLLVSSPFAAGGGRLASGIVSLFNGGAMGTLAIAQRVYAGPVAGDQIGWSIAGAGDVTGDGYDDVLVGAPHASQAALSGAGTASIYEGSDRGLPIAPSRVLEGTTMDEGFGASLASNELEWLDIHSWMRMARVRSPRGT